MRRALEALALMTALTLPAGAFQASPRWPGDAVFLPAANPSGSYLGVGVEELTPERAKAMKMAEERGVYVTRVEAGSPAEKAGIQTGDVVLEYNGQRIEGVEQFVRMVHETPAGRRMKLLVGRDGATRTLLATLGARPAAGPRIQAGLAPLRISGFDGPDAALPDIPGFFYSGRTGLIGVQVETLPPQLAAYFGVKTGVLVRTVLDDSPASHAGIKAGDVIVRVDEEPVVDISDLLNLLATARAKGSCQIAMMRERKETKVQVSLEPGQGSSGEGAPATPVRLQPQG